MANAAPKRSASSAEIDPNVDKERLRTQEPLQSLFVYTNNDTCIVLHRAKLLSCAPDSWFAKLIADPARGTDGDTQETPHRLALPTWFVQDVADWTQPMSTDKLHSAHSDAALKEMLNAIGWKRTERDLPVAFLEPVSEPLRPCTLRLIVELHKYLPMPTTSKLGSPTGLAEEQNIVFHCPSFGSRPRVEDCFATYALTEKEMTDFFAVDTLSPLASTAQKRLLVVSHQGGVCNVTFYCGNSKPDAFTPVGIHLKISLRK